MDQDLRYPIGQFEAPKEITADYLKNCIARINAAPEKLAQAISGLTDEQLDSPYRPGGWTVRQLVHHIPDSHLNCYIRFHWALTEARPTIKAYDEQRWAELPYLADVPVETSLSLLASLHARWIVLLENLTEDDMDRSFIHPEDGKAYTLRLAIPLYAWHGDHHIAHIEALRRQMGW